MVENLKGIIPAIISPCNEHDEFQEDTFATLALHLFQEGVNGLYVCGATGDGYNMRIEERKRASEIAVEVSKQFSGTVIAHVGTNNTRDSIALAEHAVEVGVHAVAAMPPPNHSTRELVKYYKDVLTAAQLPFLIYHIPHLTGHDLPLSVFYELLEISGVIGVKFSGSNLFLMKQILLAYPDAVVFNGDDELLCPALLYGAIGGIGMTYNIFPRLFVSLFSAVQSSSFSYAMKLQNLFNRFLHIAMKYGIMPVLNLMMAERGFGPFVKRRPRTVLNKKEIVDFHNETRSILQEIDNELSN